MFIVTISIEMNIFTEFDNLFLGVFTAHHYVITSKLNNKTNKILLNS